MKWSDKEEEALMLCQQRGGGWPQIAALAVKLVAARGGTMTEERVREYTKEGSDLGEHLATQGARIAVLEAERDGSALTHRERETLAAALHEVEAERAGIMASVTVPATVDPRWKLRIVGGGATCLSQALPRLLQTVRSSLQQPAGPVHPERVKEGSEALKAMHPTGSCTCAGEGICTWCDETARAADKTDAFERGAEAMRAACLEAVQRVATIAGAHGLLPVFKAAIEGATP